MSNFYYCNDCKKAVDLIYGKIIRNVSKEATVCKECGGTNWKAILDNESHKV